MAYQAKDLLLWGHSLKDFTRNVYINTSTNCMAPFSL